MIIRNQMITPRRGNKHIAQGNALGSRTSDPRPERLRVGELCSGMRAKALDGGDASYSFFCPYRAEAVYSCLPRALP